MENEQQNLKPDTSVHTIVVLNEHGLPAATEDKPSGSDRLGIPAPLQHLLNIGNVISVLVILWLMYWAIFGLLSLEPASIPSSLVMFGFVAMIVLANTLLRRFVQKKYSKGIPEIEQEKHRLTSKLSRLRNGRVAWIVVLSLWALSGVFASIQAAADSSSVAGIAPLMTFPLALVSIVGIIITSLLINKTRKRISDV